MNEKLLSKLTINIPPIILVEKYMQEIAKWGGRGEWFMGGEGGGICWWVGGGGFDGGWRKEEEERKGVWMRAKGRME